MNKAVLNFHSLRCGNEENVRQKSLPAKKPKEIEVKKVEKIAAKTVVESPRLTRQRFPCEKCDMKFSTEHSLFQHQKGKLGNCFPTKKSRKIFVKSPKIELKCTKKKSVKSPKIDPQQPCPAAALKKCAKNSVKPPKIKLKKCPSKLAKNSVKSNISVEDEEDSISPKFVTNKMFRFNLASNSSRLEAPLVCKFILGKVSS